MKVDGEMERRWIVHVLGNFIKHEGTLFSIWKMFTAGLIKKGNPLQSANCLYN